MRGYSAVALNNPKSECNVGGVLRAAQVYGASLVIVGGNRPKQYMGNLATDTMKAYRHMPVQRIENLRDAIPYDCVPVAIELVEGSQNLVEFKHPERAMYVFGAEDATLGNSVLSWCKHIVSVPTSGCMNLAACVNVVLYDRLAKAKQKKVGKSDD